MALDSTAWFIGGGAQHSPEVARLLAYVATQGAAGVVGVGDLRVSAQPTPNGTVAVGPGAAIIPNRYAGGGQQSYALRNATQTDLTVVATGSGGGRTDLVVARVLDPQYEGSAPADPVVFDYARLQVIQGVPAGTKTAKELGLTYPAVALAKITIPASTGTITNAMITDLRKVANPRRERSMRLLYPAVNKIMSKSGYASWPFSGVMSNIDVPSWATTIDIVGHISGVKITGTGESWGGIRTAFGSDASTQTGIILGESGRYAATTIGSHRVTAAQRGGTVDLSLQGYQTGGSGQILADYQTSIAVDWEFSEVPE